jgi:hypothetical protein
MMRRCPYVIVSAVFFGIAVATASCGDFQDPAPGSSGGVTVISNPTEAGFTNPSGIQESQPNPADQNGTVPSVAPSSSGTAVTVPSAVMRTVTLGWEPSSSQNVLGYRVYLVAVSTSEQQIIDIGLATKLAVPLRVGESYGFTVTAYNASFESQSPPYVVFQVF